MQNGWSHELILWVIISTSIVIIVTAERFHPNHKDWNKSQDDVPTDLLHALVSHILLPPALELCVKVVLLGSVLSLSEHPGSNIWPTEWPLGIQLMMALVISQFGEYWAHRLMHTVPFLWRFHATHHSPGRLYWLNAARFHPFDTAFLFIVGITPLLILGIGPDVMLLMLVWIAVHGLFQHSNIYLRLGPLNYIFSMAELHRWHHSLKLSEANANYGNNIIFWDLVFGTIHHPKDRDASKHIGLSNLSAFPKNYLNQILSPLRWKQIEHDSKATP